MTKILSDQRSIADQNGAPPDELKRASVDPEEGIRIIEALRNIKDPQVRRAITILAEALARLQKPSPM